MALSRGVKILIGAGALVAICAALAPTIAHSIVKKKLDEKLANEFGGMAHYDSVSVHWSPLGATVEHLTLGVNADDKQPIIEITSAEVVLESLFASEPHFKSVELNKVALNVKVDARGESSLAKMVREKPRSPRTQPLLIDVMDIHELTVTTKVARHPHSNTQVTSPPASPGQPLPVQTEAGTQAPGTPVSADAAHDSTVETPDSVLKVAHVHATGYTLPIPGQLLGQEKWIPTLIDGIVLSSPEQPLGDAAVKDPAAAAPATTTEPALKIARISFELAQAPDEKSPVRMRKFKAEQSESVLAGGGRTGFKHVVFSLEKGFGLQEPKEIRESGPKGESAHGTGLLIEDFQATNAQVETRGADSQGRAAFWRLKGAQIDATNLAFGAPVAAPAPGTLKIESATESSAAPGHFSLTVSNISGTYPQLTFTSSYRAEGVAAAAFSTLSPKQNVRVRQGSMGVVFSGGANDGNLNFDGSVTLSSDFEVDGSATQNMGVKLTRGQPIDHVTIDGTLKHPQIHLPSELAMIGDIVGTVLVAGPLGIIDSTIGEIPIVGSAVKEVTKTGSKILGTMTGGLLGRKDNKDK